MDIITVEKRESSAKAKQLRKSGVIPCVICGSALSESISIQIKKSAVDKMFKQNREGSKIQISLDDKMISVQIKEKSYDALSNEITHISFQVLNDDQIVNSVVHIILQNADKVTGTLEKMLLEIPYSALPENMIDTVEIDLDDFPVGSVVTVGDIKEFKEAKIELQADVDSIVFRFGDKKILSSRAE
ncbi:MAG: 50S ribosomal protein L25/general stress protein Ctc [Oscillospiraceae bacterium]